MNYCVSCEKETIVTEKDQMHVCMECGNTVNEITNTKLNGIIKDVTIAFNNINNVSTRSNAQELIRNAKVIEYTERKLKKEYLKRINELSQLQYEVKVIESIAQNVNYQLKESELKEGDEE